MPEENLQCIIHDKDESFKPKLSTCDTPKMDNSPKSNPFSVRLVSIFGISFIGGIGTGMLMRSLLDATVNTPSEPTNLSTSTCDPGSSSQQMSNGNHDLVTVISGCEHKNDSAQWPEKDKFIEMAKRVQIEVSLLFLRPGLIMYAEDRSGDLSDEAADSKESKRYIVWDSEYLDRIESGKSTPTQRFFQHVVRLHGEMQKKTVLKIEEDERRLRPESFSTSRTNLSDIVDSVDFRLEGDVCENLELKKNIETGLYLPRFVIWNGADDFRNLVRVIEGKTKKRQTSTVSLSRMVPTHQDEEVLVGKDEYFDTADLSDDGSSGLGIVWPVGYSEHYLGEIAAVDGTSIMVTRRFFQHVVRRAGEIQGKSNEEVRKLEIDMAPKLFMPPVPVSLSDGCFKGYRPEGYWDNAPRMNPLLWNPWPAPFNFSSMVQELEGVQHLSYRKYHKIVIIAGCSEPDVSNNRNSDYARGKLKNRMSDDCKRLSLASERRMFNEQRQFIRSDISLVAEELRKWQAPQNTHVIGTIDQDQSYSGPSCPSARITKLVKNLRCDSRQYEHIGSLVDFTFYFSGSACVGGELYLGQLGDKESHVISPDEFFDSLREAKITGFVEIVIDASFATKWITKLASLPDDYFSHILELPGALSPLDLYNNTGTNRPSATDPMWATQLQITLKVSSSKFSYYGEKMSIFTENWLQQRRKFRGTKTNIHEKSDHEWRWFGEYPSSRGPEYEEIDQEQSPVYMRRNFYRPKPSGVRPVGSKSKTPTFLAPFFVGYWLCKEQSNFRSVFKEETISNASADLLFFAGQAEPSGIWSELEKAKISPVIPARNSVTRGSADDLHEPEDINDESQESNGESNEDNDDSQADNENLSEDNDVVMARKNDA